MTLPKVAHPIFETNIPSTKKKIKFRPMLVKEEKILLMAKETDDENAILSAIKQVVNNCLLDDTDVDRLPIFDLEYLFIKLRANSVSNKTSIALIDAEDNLQYDFEVDLEKVEVKFPDKVDNVVKVNDEVSVVMKYPEAALYDDKELLESWGIEAIDLTIIRSIDKIFVGDSAYDVKTIDKAELKEFIENLPINVYDNIKKFFDSVPYLYYKIEYKNKLGNERFMELTTLKDFFTLR